MENRKFRKLALYLPFFICIVPLFSEEKKEEKKWYDTVNFSGYVDVYYKYATNNRQGNQYDPSGTFDGYNKQFAINNTKLAVEKVATKEQSWGFRLDIQNGSNNVFQERPYTTTNNIYNMNMLQQGYVSLFLPVAKGLTIDIGKMATHLGNEVLDSKDNINYTIGYIFFNTIPFIHTGARATLAVSDDWTAAFFLYNSIMGTGYSSPYSPFKDPNMTRDNPNNASGNPTMLTDTTRWNANDKLSKTPAIGTQLKGNLLKDRIKIVWNTGFGSDLDQGRISNGNYMAGEYLQYSGSTALPARPNAKFDRDYWFINHAQLIFTPTEKIFLLLDWTYGERSGSAAEYFLAYVNEGNKIIDLNNDGVGDISTNRSGNKVKRIYNTYGIWFKYTFTEKFALALRYEYIDDSRYGGPLVVNAPLYGQIPANRMDLDPNYNRINGNSNAKPQANLGQVRTYTFTPTYIWNENLIIKLDLRHDRGLGEQFIDERGRPSKYQNAAILGVVVKF